VGKYKMEVVSESCTGCMLCQLACSELYTGTFSLEKARIRVLISDRECTISFSNECNNCGVCADYCLYGALIKMPGEAEK
jgi:Fe-S-cluster-containing dehydrogenase component